MTALRRMVSDLLTPGEGLNPHHKATTGLSHGVVGAALAVPLVALGMPPVWAALTVCGAYLIAKELPDMHRGGTWRDGLSDTAYVGIGACWPLAPMWTPWLLLAAAGVEWIINDRSAK